jgi:hypothetical protein
MIDFCFFYEAFSASQDITANRMIAIDWKGCKRKEGGTWRA